MDVEGNTCGPIEDPIIIYHGGTLKHNEKPFTK
jgi:hypothetical protein